MVNSSQLVSKQNSIYLMQDELKFIRDPETGLSSLLADRRQVETP